MEDRSADVVLYEAIDGIAWLTLNRAEARNALNAALRAGLWDGFRRFNDDSNARVMVLTGAGQVFSAGGDLKEMAHAELGIPDRDYIPQIGRNINVPKPVIAAVNGAALGGGFLLAQNCDLCVASATAQFGIPEARWGRGAPWAALLPWLIPPRVAMEILLTGEPISADRAYEIGLVNQVVPPEQLRNATIALARRIADNAPLTLRASKAMIRGGTGHLLAELYANADQHFAPIYLSHDALEGPRAFREHRKPRWEGR
jgi:enoyl-CoA hydratase/carnithine racemase